MQNNFRYDKLNMLIHLQHQRSHYRRIIQAKKCIQFHDEQLASNPKQSHSTRIKTQLQPRPQHHPSHYETGSIVRSKQVYKRSANKYNQQKQRQRKQNNLKLVNKIGEINKQSGILQAMYNQAQNYVKNENSNRNLASNASSKKIQEHRIMDENAKFAQRLAGVKPAVGTVSQWKTHYKNFRNTEKRIQKNNSYDPELHLRKTISSLTGTNSDIFFNSSKRRKTSISQSSQKSIRHTNEYDSSQYSLIKTLEEKLTMPKKPQRQQKRTLKQRVQTQNQHRHQIKLKRETKYLSSHLNNSAQGEQFKQQVNIIMGKQDGDRQKYNKIRGINLLLIQEWGEIGKIIKVCRVIKHHCQCYDNNIYQYYLEYFYILYIFICVQIMRSFESMLVRIIKMDNLNKSPQRAQRTCTTPERMRMVQSIKKSIHRSIDKIDPSDYKNILKGEYIFLHLCHKGQVINSEYQKVALFMGAVMMKKATQKITAVVTNERHNKTVKKLAAMGKPVLSVLWLQACFQEKRKVPYEDFPLQSDKKQQANEQQKQEQNLSNYDALANIYQSHLEVLIANFHKNHPSKLIRYLDKRQKMDKNKVIIIAPHQIDIGVYQQHQPQARRKSQNLAQGKAIRKKVQKKKTSQIKSQGLQKQKKQSLKVKSVTFEKILDIDQDQLDNIIKEDQNLQSNANTNLSKNQQNSKQSNGRLNRNVYQKYLKDFNKYEQKIKQYDEGAHLKIQENETPCFNFNGDIDKKNYHCQDNDMYNKQEGVERLQTPMKSSWQDTDEVFKTCSLKKLNRNIIKLCIINPIISQKIQKINKMRQQQDLPQLQVSGNQSKDQIFIISKQSKIQAILAMLSKPRQILSQSFLINLQKSPLTQISPEFLRQFQINCVLNIGQIQGKNIVLLDSVMGVSSLSKIIKQCNACVVSMADYLFGGNKVDIIVTNKKKMYMKSQSQRYTIMTEAAFIDMLISF